MNDVTLTDDVRDAWKCLAAVIDGSADPVDAIRLVGRVRSTCNRYWALGLIGDAGGYHFDEWCSRCWTSERDIRMAVAAGKGVRQAVRGAIRMLAPLSGLAVSEPEEVAACDRS